jgi:hypothetical protein
MIDEGFTDELHRALARPDAEAMIRQIDAFAAYSAREDSGEVTGGWPDDHADDFSEILTCHHDDPNKALAYVVIAASRTDDASFLGSLACGNLEDVLREPSDDFIARIVAEARKSACFRWLLSNPFKVAVSKSAWEAIEQFRSTGPHEEPSFDTLPSRDAN